MNRLLTAAGFALLLLLVGCGPGDEEASQDGDAEAVQTATAEEETVLRGGLVSLPPSLGNPFRSTNIPSILTYSAMFDGLTRITEDGELIPWLAERWENPEPNRWIFYLRDGVTFHDGTPFTSEAVVTVVEYLTSDAARRETVATELRALESARAIDELTVEITTDVTDPLLPRSMPIMYMVQPDLWKQLGPDGFARQPVGTGPFKLDEWFSAHAELSAHRGGWREPMVDKLELYAIPENSARLQGVQSGRLDFALALGPEEANTAELSGQRGVAWVNPATFGLTFLLEQNPDHPIQDVRVRRALNYAVNKQQIVDVLLMGQTVPIAQPAPRVALGHNPSIEPYPYDPDKARALLAEAGYPDGFSFIMEGVMGGGAADAAVYQQVAQDLAAIGVEMEIRPFPVQQLIASISNGEWNGQAFGMSYATEPSLDGLRSLRLHSCMWRAPWYCDESIMPKIYAAFDEGDIDRRVELTREIMQFYRDQAPALWLYEIVRFAALDKNLAGFAEINGMVSYDRMHFVE